MDIKYFVVCLAMNSSTELHLLQTNYFFQTISRIDYTSRFITACELNHEVLNKSKHELSYSKNNLKQNFNVTRRKDETTKSSLKYY